MQQILIFIFILIINSMVVPLAISADSSGVTPQPVNSKQYICDKTASYEDHKWVGDWNCSTVQSMETCPEGWVMFDVNKKSDTGCGAAWLEPCCKVHCAKLTTNCRWADTPN